MPIVVDELLGGDAVHDVKLGCQGRPRLPQSFPVWRGKRGSSRGLQSFDAEDWQSNSLPTRDRRGGGSKGPRKESKKSVPCIRPQERNSDDAHEEHQRREAAPQQAVRFAQYRYDDRRAKHNEKGCAQTVD